MDLERVLQGTPFTLQEQWTEGDVATNPGTVTIGITSIDGTEIVPAGTATGGSGTAVRTFNLTTTHTALLDRLLVTWTSSDKGVLKSVVEVVGGFLFSAAEARTQLGNPTYDLNKIYEARMYAESELEAAVGYALVPRYQFSTVMGNWPVRMRRYVRSIRSVTADGVAYTPGQLAELWPLPGGLLGRSSYAVANPWWGYPSRITIGYEHGLDSPPPGAKRAALAVALEFLGGGTGSVDPRADRLITDDGTLVFSSSSGGQFRAPGVNQWVASNRLPNAA